MPSSVKKKKNTWRTWDGSLCYRLAVRKDKAEQGRKNWRLSEAGKILLEAEGTSTVGWIPAIQGPPWPYIIWTLTLTSSTTLRAAKTGDRNGRLNGMALRRSWKWWGNLHRGSDRAVAVFWKAHSEYKVGTEWKRVTKEAGRLPKRRQDCKWRCLKSLEKRRAW